ncbi:hypothetical protein B4U79_08548 [Dinothrombium tinctorium]|uniref:Luciferin 4-monooxygenase-like protein n=1 Tax=Dinothrombium tinctorium TaxID=1965070 RepID=A0A3S3NTW2_9ACAR|nr:hypothetical protein B4U79_08548 [Dinothrombium tinctorium]
MSEYKNYIKIKDKVVSSTLKLDLPSYVLPKLILERLSKIADKTILIQCETGLKWKAKEIIENVVKIGCKLNEIGVKKGEYVVAYCPSDYRQAFTFLAVASIGAVYTGCLHNSPMAELKKVVNATNAKYLIACKANLNIASQVYNSSAHLNSSEAGLITMNCQSKGTSDLESVGLPINEVKIKIVDPETKSKLDAYQTGEICVKSPQIFTGYLNDNLLTKERFDEEGFFKTGDAGYYDEDGNIYFVTRYSSLLKYDGWCISPSELEMILQKHEAVKEAAVVGIDAGIMGQTPKAFVELQEQWQNKVDASELLNYFNSLVPYYKQLRGGLVIVDSFPRTSIGKINRKLLVGR